MRSQPVMTLRAPSLALAVAAALLVAVPGASAAQPRSLRVIRSWPLQVSGAGFYAHERVTVTVRTGHRVRTARARTGPGGAFTARFARVRLDVCALPFSVTARGARGDSARAPRPLRDCAS
jgi:hypothetical protein